jgi:hypothetical protein
MSSFNLKSGLKRIWIVLSVLYLIFAAVSLLENSDCIGYFNRLALIQEDEKKNPSDLSRFAVVELGGLGQCDDIFIWKIGNDKYANIGTMLGATLGGLILLWLVPYTLIFWVGGGLYWILCWIKAGFITESSKSNESEAKVKGEEEKDLYFVKKRLFFEQTDTDETIDKTTNLTADANEEGDWGTFPWAAKAILLQLFAFLSSVMIIAAITTYITPLKPSYRISLNVIIAVASFFPIWQPGKRNFKRKFISWLLSALAGCIIYLSGKTVLLSLYKAGVLSIHQTAKISGYTVGLGIILSIFLSYFLNKRGQK